MQTKSAFMWRNSQNTQIEAVVGVGESFWDRLKDIFHVPTTKVIVVCSPWYLSKVQALSPSGVKREYELIQERLGRKEKGWLYPFVICGDATTSVPQSWRDLNIQAFTLTEDEWVEAEYVRLHRALGDAVTRVHWQEPVPAGHVLQWGPRVCDRCFINNISKPNTNFFHIQAEGSDQTYLQRLKELLFSNGHVAIAGADTGSATVVGMGGVGKTQLVLAYADAALQAGQYDLIWWVRSETPDKLHQSYSELIEEIFSPENWEQYRLKGHRQVNSRLKMVYG